MGRKVKKVVLLLVPTPTAAERPAGEVAAKRDGDQIPFVTLGGVRNHAPVSKHGHILTASSNLLGIALVIIMALTVTGRAPDTFADSVTWLAVGGFISSCLLSYLAIRAEPKPTRFERWADRAFLLGLVALTAAVALFGFEHG